MQQVAATEDGDVTLAEYDAILEAARKSLLGDGAIAESADDADIVRALQQRSKTTEGDIQ